MPSSMFSKLGLSMDFCSLLTKIITKYYSPLNRDSSSYELLFIVLNHKFYFGARNFKWVIIQNLCDRDFHYKLMRKLFLQNGFTVYLQLSWVLFCSMKDEAEFFRYEATVAIFELYGACIQDLYSMTLSFNYTFNFV